MAFVFNRPPSPSARDYNQQLGHEDDLHAPLSQSTTPAPELQMRDKERPRLEIILDAPQIYLKGTGVDVEPSRLSGHVALYLSESTSIREITLQFRGKARLPDSIQINKSTLDYIVCSYDWSFLEGEKRRNHTLKAGRHFFPFQLELGGSLPSSIFSTAIGGASVSYKLRAHAVRPGLGRDLQATIPVTILRSFSSDALEYQQTLEIEDTWPEKLMYSILVPHKAWAAGDTLTALMKFSPLEKGVGVLNVTTSLHEKTKVLDRVGYQQHTRVIGTTVHEIVGGKAIDVTVQGGTPRSSTTGRAATPDTPASRRSSVHPSPGLGEAGPSAPATLHVPGQEDNLEPNDTDIVTSVSFPIPLSTVPTHTVDPIIVSHRLHWSIVIMNPDGHTSELRCSISIHLLDHQLLEESRACTAATRSLLLGEPEASPQEREDMQLPSYTAHIRDRVANMFMPESATMRVTNPWVHLGVSPTIVGSSRDSSSPWPRSPSGRSTPLEAHLPSHLPQTPGSGDSPSLEWVDSELLYSLSLSERLHGHSPLPKVKSNHLNSESRPSKPLTTIPLTSRPASTHVSGLPSRSSSPDHIGNIETYVHAEAHASRQLQSLLKASIKPFTSISHHWLSRSNSQPHSAPTPSFTPEPQQQQHASAEHCIQLPDPNSGAALLHRAFTFCPDYSVASRGFIGGVPPLSSMRGLPSYDEVERLHTDSGSVSHFARANSCQSVPVAPQNVS